MHDRRDSVGGSLGGVVKLGSEQVAVAVAAGNSQGRSGSLHARAAHVAGIDCVPQRDVGITFRAHITNGSETGQQRQACVLDANKRRARNGDAKPFVTATAGVRGKVSVNINKARQEGSVTKIDNSSVRG